MKKLICVLCWFWAVGGGLAQPEIEWQKSFGGSDFDEARSIQQTSDGGYVITGNVVSNNGDVSGHHGNNDYWVVKLDNLGDLQWKKAFGGSANDWPYSIQQVNGNGYVVAGFTDSSDGNIAGNHGDKDAWVIKIDNNGILEWQKCFGGSLWEAAHSIKPTIDGGYVFAGIAESLDGDVSGIHGDLDFWVVKLDENGIIQWQKTFGGSKEDFASSIIQTTDGGYMVAGRAQSQDGDVTGHHGSSDYWLIKLSPIGAIEWQKALGGNSIDVAEDVIQTLDGGYVVAGYAFQNITGDITGHHGGYVDFWVVRLSASGELIWQKALGGSGREWGREVQQRTDGNLIVAGSSESNDGDASYNHGNQDTWVLELNFDSGEVLWEKSLGGTLDELCFSVTETMDKGLALAGFNWSSDGDATSCKGKNDFWVVKLSPNSTPTTNPSTYTQPLTLSPNPAQNTLSIQTQEPGKTDLQIYNLLGQALQHQSLEMSDLGAAQVDISQLPNGLYIISATTASGRVLSGRFLKA